MAQLVFFIFQKRFSAFFAIPLLINRKSNDFIETTLSSTLNELFFFIRDIPVLGWGLIATWWIFLITTSCKHPIKKLNLVLHIGFSKSCLENGMILFQNIFQINSFYVILKELSVSWDAKVKFASFSIY